MKALNSKSLLLSVFVTTCMTFIFFTLVNKINGAILSASDYIQIANTIGLSYLGIAALFMGYKGAMDVFGKNKEAQK